MKKIRFGLGRAQGSFGEIVQGRLPDESDFLVTLPIALESLCQLESHFRPGPIDVTCDRPKAKLAAETLLAENGIHENYDIRLMLGGSIPVGKGLSSSTADMLAAVRSVEHAFGVKATTEQLSRIFSQIEPHDGLMFPECVVYDHRQGRLLQALQYVPDYWIIGVDFGGQKDTIEYNRNLKFNRATKASYENLLRRLSVHFSKRDDIEIARCASESTQMHLEQFPDQRRLQFLKDGIFSPWGVVNTHSGTCLGLIFPRSLAMSEVKIIASEIRSHYGLPCILTWSLGTNETAARETGVQKIS